ncbi:metallophosphoesterase family protein [Aquibacillus albus]|uniref:DNA repair exonuclease SbcCD nuclease subunit n=1 Tax=Aquibacillus albus TaxID=1168171 RepID=A0ABS2N020_9BACI|nr:DNA repair exonuclease [Aquibacillus albus]MBM7571441.1 DNA repair exonuclease SbcCD nuclease subunit [Aquibacillus albus]
MNDNVSFIHCADLHIDSPFKGLSNLSPELFKDVRESTFKALDRLVHVAIKKQVDFILIVGDLFDSEQQSMKAQSRLMDAFQQLYKHDIDVFVSYGNHDYLNGRMFYMDYPTNVHVFESEQVSHFIYNKHQKPTATIYGFSYENRSVHHNKAHEFHKEGDTPFHIGMLHGSLRSNTDHDVYAPFQISDLNTKNFDYWALGHIHKRQIVGENPPIVYPGNIQGRSKKETGEKGCYYVEMDGQHCSYSFVPLQHIRFEELHVDAIQCQQPLDLESLVDQAIKSVKEDIGKCILRINMTNCSNEIEAWYQAGFVQEMIDVINERYEKEMDWVYIQSFHVDHQVIWDKDELMKANHFIGELLRAFESSEETDAYVQPLLHHRQARKYLHSFTDEEKKEILSEAEELLMHHLMKE